VDDGGRFEIRKHLAEAVVEVHRESCQAVAAAAPSA
jgi:hypothetical protein